MPKKFVDISVKLIGDQGTPVDPSLVPKSAFLQHAFSLNADVIVAQLAEGSVKDQSLGSLWSSIKPDNGCFKFEIATVLPFFLPRVRGKPEYAVLIRDTELVVCSRMARCFYTRADGTTNPLEYFLVHQLGIDDLSKHGFAAMHPLPLKTFISKRFDVAAKTVEGAVKTGFLEWRRHFLRDVSELIDGMRAASPAAARHLFPQLATPSFPMLWVAVEGEGGVGGAVQFIGDLEQVAFSPVTDLDDDAASRLAVFLERGVKATVDETALALARTFNHYGYGNLAIVHVCTACEYILTRMYELFLESRGVSRSKYKNAKRDITFSQLLNLHFPTACEISSMDGHEAILTSLNLARKCRNEILHEGRLRAEMSADQVERMVQAARALTAFVLSQYPRIRD